MARKKFESVEQLLLKTPLYEEVEGKRMVIVKSVLTFTGAVDTYCPGCKQTATFRGDLSGETNRNVQIQAATVIGSNRAGPASRPWEQSRFSKTLTCTRDGHPILYHFYCADEFVVKVGQYPSMADIEKGDTDRFEPVLGRERLKELNRGIGLASHGVGIGAHVYLRRIFEGLVEEAHVAALKQAGWDDAKYMQARMAERVRLLDEHLPRFLSENPRLYAILSQGIHELTEQECLANFEALKLCIEVILDEKLAEREKRDKAEAARKALAQIDGEKKSGG